MRDDLTAVVLELCGDGWEALAEIKEVSLEALVCAAGRHLHALPPDRVGGLRNGLKRTPVRAGEGVDKEEQVGQRRQRLQSYPGCPNNLAEAGASAGVSP